MTSATVRERTATGWRAATGDAVLVARRRSAQDSGLLLLAAIVLAVTVLIALAVPRVVLETADAGLQESVRRAGASADVVALVTAPDYLAEISTGTGTVSRKDNASTVVANAASSMSRSLPPALRAVTTAPVTSARSIPFTAVVHGEALASRLVHVGGPGGEPVVRWVAGREPGPTTPPDPASGDPQSVEVGMSTDAAAEFGVDPGDSLLLGGATGAKVQTVVAGLYEVIDPASPAWSTYSDLTGVAPAAPGSATGAVARVGLLLSDSSLPDMMPALPSVHAAQMFYRFPTDASALQASDLRQVRSDITRLKGWPEDLTLAGGEMPTIASELDTVLTAVNARLHAANAQTSVLLVGLAAVGALALVLAARLLVVRRQTFLLAERARGASVASVAVRALVETVPLVVAATVVGAAGAYAISQDPRGSWTVAATIVVVAVLAPAVAAAVVVSGAWTGRRLPANRADRQRMLGRRRARRVTAELALVAVAAAALVSVRGRGLLQTATGDVDLLLSATPVLLAAAATVLVARVLPPTLRVLSRLAARRTGLVPVVATARASHTAGTRVPLLSLTIAVALVVFCGTTAVTVTANQAKAADIVVGADVRVDGPVGPEDLAALREAPGVTAVAGARYLGDRTFGKSSGVKGGLLLVDAAELATIMRAHGRTADAQLAALGASDGDAVPALIGPALQSTADLMDPAVMGTTRFVQLRVIGQTEHPPTLPHSTSTLSAAVGVILVDRGRFEAVTGEPVSVSTTWVDGPGAAAAVRASGLTDLAAVTVTERTAWLTDWQGSPLNAGLLALLVTTGLILAGYAALGLVLTVVATSRERGRTLSALRTLGLDARTGRAMTFGELAPLAISAVLAGTAIGIGVPAVLTGALGLDLLTGAAEATDLRVTWVPIAGAAVVVLGSLAIAVAVESAVRRRDRLGEVLRVGER